MKNFLIKSLYEIQSADWDVRDRSKETDLYNKYVECHQISLGTFKERLMGDWTYEFIGGKFETIHLALRHTFYEIYRIWKEHSPCNIIYTDPDTIARAPVEIWNRYDKFMMFNYSEPKYFHVKNKYHAYFPHFFNAGVRYFPASMSEDTWKIGLDMAATWDLDDYNTEQIILNRMMWSQGLHVSDALVPSVVYQAHWLPGLDYWRQDLWNGIHINNASIIHVHSSRDIDRKLAWMKFLANIGKTA